MKIHWPPLAVCCVLAVPTFAIAAVLHDRPAPDQVSTLDPPVYVVHDVTTAVPTTEAPPVVSAPPAPAVVTQTADRGIMLQVTPTVPPPVPTGVWGLPFAPTGLERCDEAMWYAAQFGIPASMRYVVWGESNCRNDVISKTGCCYGTWQLNVSVHLADHRMGPRYSDCGIDSADDVHGNSAIDKQRNACGAKAVLDISGCSAWDVC